MSSNRQRFAQQRNWTKKRLLALKCLDTKAMSGREKRQWSKIKKMLDEIVAGWEKEYQILGYNPVILCSYHKWGLDDEGGISRVKAVTTWKDEHGIILHLCQVCYDHQVEVVRRTQQLQSPQPNQNGSSSVPGQSSEYPVTNNEAYQAADNSSSEVDSGW